MAGDHLVWDPNPFLIQSDLINVRWYGVLFLGGFLVGQWLVHKHFRRDGLDEGNIPALFNTMFFSTLIGARLGHCFFYEPQHYLLNPLEIPQFWKGGLASHGGMVGIFIGLWWYRQRRRELTYLGLLDVLSLPAAITCAAIRFGNLMNSEIIGHRSQVPWAMVFPAVDGEHGLPRHPVQLYEVTNGQAGRAQDFVVGSGDGFRLFLDSAVLSDRETALSLLRQAIRQIEEQDDPPA